MRSNHCVACVQFPLSEMERSQRARAFIRSHFIGLRLYGIADEPTCFLPNGSSTSFRCWSSRTSFANFEADAARPESAESTRASCLRVYVWPEIRRRSGKPGLLGDELVEPLGLVGVAVEERDERGLRARGPLAAEEPQLVGAADELAVVEREVLEPEAGALADGRGLRRPGSA